MDLLGAGGNEEKALNNRPVCYPARRDTSRRRETEGKIGEKNEKKEKGRKGRV